MQIGGMRQQKQHQASDHRKDRKSFPPNVPMPMSHNSSDEIIIQDQLMKRVAGKAGS